MGADLIPAEGAEGGDPAPHSPIANPANHAASATDSEATVGPVTPEARVNIPATRIPPTVDPQAAALSQPNETDLDAEVDALVAEIPEDIDLLEDSPHLAHPVVSENAMPREGQSSSGAAKNPQRRL